MERTFQAAPVSETFERPVIKITREVVDMSEIKAGDVFCFVDDLMHPVFWHRATNDAVVNSTGDVCIDAKSFDRGDD
jgi:hypothetical protein